MLFEGVLGTNDIVVEVEGRGKVPFFVFLSYFLDFGRGVRGMRQDTCLFIAVSCGWALSFI